MILTFFVALGVSAVYSNHGPTAFSDSSVLNETTFQEKVLSDLSSLTLLVKQAILDTEKLEIQNKKLAKARKRNDKLISKLRSCQASYQDIVLELRSCLPNQGPKTDDCGGCPKGSQCVLVSLPCPPGRICIQVMEARCRPIPCLACPAHTVCTATEDAGTVSWSCALPAIVECGNTEPCPDGQRCHTSHRCPDDQPKPFECANHTGVDIACTVDSVCVEEEESKEDIPVSALCAGVTCEGNDRQCRVVAACDLCLPEPRCVPKKALENLPADNICTDEGSSAMLIGQNSTDLRAMYCPYSVIDDDTCPRDAQCVADGIGGIGVCCVPGSSDSSPPGVRLD